MKKKYELSGFYNRHQHHRQYVHWIKLLWICSKLKKGEEVIIKGTGMN